MRPAILAMALLLTACGGGEEKTAEQPATAAAAEPGLTVYAGAGRDRLCLDERAGRAAFITYGDGDLNCTVQGAVQGGGETRTLVPDGDATCRIDLASSGDMIRLGEVTSSCAYYCGARTSFAGAQFRRSENAGPATDLAGDALC